MLDWLRDELLSARMVAPSDVDMLVVTDDTREAVDVIVECYERRCAKVGPSAVED